MCLFTGDYTKQRKKGKVNFTYYAFTPHTLKGVTLFKTSNEFTALWDETHRVRSLSGSILSYALNKNLLYELLRLKECFYSRIYARAEICMNY